MWRDVNLSVPGVHVVRCSGRATSVHVRHPRDVSLITIESGGIPDDVT